MNAKRWLLCYLAALAALLAASALRPQSLDRSHLFSERARQFGDENRALAEEVARLRREAKALSGEPAALERAAREELGYVRPGEIVFLLPETGRRP